MTWPNLPETNDQYKDLLEQTMRCPHCDELIFKVNVEELGYCPECEETIK